jgi:uncharacterized protein YdeI (YjbR/CyaY-like superfamily)
MKQNAKNPSPGTASSAPDDLAKALRDDAAAQANFSNLPPSCRREYLEWIVSARKPETRARRINAAIAMLREGRRHGDAAPR